MTGYCHLCQTAYEREHPRCPPGRAIGSVTEHCMRPDGSWSVETKTLYYQEKTGKVVAISQAAGIPS